MLGHCHGTLVLAVEAQMGHSSRAQYSDGGGSENALWISASMELTAQGFVNVVMRRKLKLWWRSSKERWQVMNKLVRVAFANLRGIQVI